MHGVRPTSGFDWGSIGPRAEMGQRTVVPRRHRVGYRVGYRARQRVGYRGPREECRDRLDTTRDVGSGRFINGLPGASPARRSGPAVEAERSAAGRRPSERGSSRPPATAASGYLDGERRAGGTPTRKWCVVPPGTNPRQVSRSRTRRTHEATDRQGRLLGPGRRGKSPAIMFVMHFRCT